MPPVNPRVEAVRLQQAKVAIKKMRKKRKESSRVRTPNVRSQPQASVSPITEVPTAHVNPNDALHTVHQSLMRSSAALPIGKKKVKSRKPAAKDRSQRLPPVKKSLWNGDHPSGFVSASPKKQIKRADNVVKSLPGNPKSLTNPPRFDETVTIFNSPVTGEAGGCAKTSSSYLGCTKSRKKSSHPLEIKPLSDESPFVRPGGIQKVYFKKMKPDTSIENGKMERRLKASHLDDTNWEEPDELGLNSPARNRNDCEFWPSYEDEEPGPSDHVFRRNKVSNFECNPHKPNKYNVQMSISEKVKVMKNPVFGCHDSSSQSNDSVMLCDQVLDMGRSDHHNVSGFTVTSACKSKLPSPEKSDQENSSREDVDETLSTTDNEDEGEQLEIETRQQYNHSSSTQFHFIDGEVILQLKHPSSFVFCGQLEVEVLKGAVEVLGYLLLPSSGSNLLFSPRGSSLLTLQTVVIDFKNGPSSSTLDSSFSALIEKGDEEDVFLLLKKGKDKLPLFLEQYLTMKLFPLPTDKQEEGTLQKACRKLQCLLRPPSGCNVIEKGESWDEISSSIIQKSGCTVLCGGKGVGKSTMLRFLLNRFLCSGFQSVLLIDFDPGQAELTVPGCVSISILKKPLLGPNFTHLQTSLKCIYVGDVNIANCVSHYVEACSSIIEFWRSEEQFRDTPCLVNTMGFNKGLGVTLMIQLLSSLQPTSVIQICSKSVARNYPENLSDEYVKKNYLSSPFSIIKDIHCQETHLPSSIKYDLYTVKSCAEAGSNQRNSWGLDPWLSREIVILSYFSPAESNMSLLEMVPYSCPLDALYLNVSHQPVMPSITLAAFNATFVALCNADPEENDVVEASQPGHPGIIKGHVSGNCLGFGIVRGIDMESKQLYLLTPVSPSTLLHVNCLVLGAVSLPSSIYLTPPRETGFVPYVISSENRIAAKPTKRVFRFF